MPTQPAVLPHTIVLEGDLRNRHMEYRAAAAFKPGHLLEVHTDGKVRKHSTAAVPGRRLFAKEDPLIGRTIDTAYAADELTPCHDAQPGDLIYGWVPAAATAIGVGKRLMSNGDGTVVVSTATTDHIIGTADEAVDNSAGGAEARICIRVIA